MPSTQIKKHEKHAWDTYTVVAVTDKGPSPPQGSQGLYTVTFTLSNSQNVFVSDIHPATSEDGDSNIYLWTPETEPASRTAKLRVASGSGIIYSLVPKENGQLGIIETEPFQANNFENATSLAHNNISPFLSRLSFETQTPLLIKKIDAMELNTGSQRFICLPEPRSRLYMHTALQGSISDQLSGLLAEYREAKNASSLPIYQLFCYFKIIDGYIAIRSERAKSGNRSIRADDKITSGDYKGKKIGWFKDKLENDFRDSFAHFYYDDKKTPMSPDNMDNIYLVFKMLSPAEDVARQVIENVVRADESDSA